MKFLFLIIALSVSASFYAQLNGGTAYSNSFEDKDNLVSVLGCSSTEVFVISENSQNFFVNSFDRQTLELLSSVQIFAQKVAGKELSIERVTLLDGKPVVFSSGSSADKSKFNVYMSELDAIEGVSSEPALIFTSEETLGRDKQEVQISVSPDQQSFMIIKPVASKNRMRHFYGCFTADGTKLYESFTDKDLVSGESYGLISYSCGTQNRFGFAFTSVIYDKTKKQYLSVLDICRVSRRGTEFASRITKVPMHKGKLITTGLMFSGKDNLVLTGNFLVSDRRTVTGVKGVFRYVIGENDDTGLLSVNNYSEQIRQKAIRGAMNMTEAQIPSFYRPVQAFGDDEENTYLLTERQMITSLGGGISEYYYGSVIVTKMNAAGDFIYEDFVSKSQFYKQAGIPLFIPIGFSPVFTVNLKRDTRKYLSFGSVLKDGKVYLVFNDDKGNDGKSDTRENLMKPSESAPVVVEISPEGKHTYQMHGEWKDESTVPHFSQSIGSGSSEIYFISSDKKTEKLGVLKLD